jgi:hypothetical protein
VGVGGSCRQKRSRIFLEGWKKQLLHIHGSGSMREWGCLGIPMPLQCGSVGLVQWCGALGVLWRCDSVRGRVPKQYSVGGCRNVHAAVAPWHMYAGGMIHERCVVCYLCHSPFPTPAGARFVGRLDLTLPESHR